jgi:hypothetical protein
VALNALKDIIDNGRDDLAIATEPELVVTIGGRPIHCRAFTLANHTRWTLAMGTALHSMSAILAGLEWPETKEGIERIRKTWTFALSTAKVQKQMMRLIEQTLFREPGNGWWRWHRGYFRTRVTVNELTDLFFYMYLWNHEAVKKNVTFLLQRMGFIRHKATFLSSSAQNLGGMSGAQVKPRSPSSAFSSSGTQNSTTSSRPSKAPASRESKAS